MDAAYPRELTGAERSTLDRLLGIEFPGVEDLRVQARTAKVEAVCPCGCGSFGLTTDPTLPAASVVSPTPSGGVMGQDEETVELILWAREGRLGGVEVVDYSDVAREGILPDPNAFQISPGTSWELIRSPREDQNSTSTRRGYPMRILTGGLVICALLPIAMGALYLSRSGRAGQPPTAS